MEREKAGKSCSRKIQRSEAVKMRRTTMSKVPRGRVTHTQSGNATPHVEMRSWKVGEDPGDSPVVDTKRREFQEKGML